MDSSHLSNHQRSWKFMKGNTYISKGVHFSLFLSILQIVSHNIVWLLRLLKIGQPEQFRSCSERWPDHDKTQWQLHFGEVNYRDFSLIWKQIWRKWQGNDTHFMGYLVALYNRTLILDRYFIDLYQMPTMTKNSGFLEKCNWSGTA